MIVSECPININGIYEVKVRYHEELYPNMKLIEKIDKGDFIDLAAAETVNLHKGDFALISLGVSMELPSGTFAMLVPRSSTFKNYGILQTNSVGIIDESYCGDDDIWKMPVFATRDIVIEKGNRIAQFAIFEKNRINITRVDKLDNKNRDGFGSTGI